MKTTSPTVNLQEIARQTLSRFGFLTETPAPALAELAALIEPDFSRLALKDMTGAPWSSIDNDDSRDLDQIEYLQPEQNAMRLFVGIADVASFVKQGSALDQAALHNTTSLYTGVRTFPMLPDKLSTDLTSLVEGQKRLADVVEMLVTTPDGQISEVSLYRAIVRNQAQLTYHAAGAWLQKEPGDGSPVTLRVLDKIRSNAGLQEQLRLQDQLAGILHRTRLEAGALTFETPEIRPELSADQRWQLEAETHNAATQLIEDFMIAANRAAVRFLDSKGFPSFRRVVRTPKDWPQIIKLAERYGTHLPAEPDSKALEEFLSLQRQQNPEQFPDLSLATIKLLGRGEYVVARPGEPAPGHFALAVEGYAHSTAPNRRYPDIITQRLIQAALEGREQPYSLSELDGLAAVCTEREDAANKAERSIHKSVIATEMTRRIGETFDGMVTGASPKGVWVRLKQPPIEGKLDVSSTKLAVGDAVSVKLVSTDPWRGYIDFQLLGRR